MVNNLLKLSLHQRRFVFILLVIGVLLALVAVTYLLITGALNSGRSLGIALLPNITVREFAQLPDNNSYPSTVTVAPDGTVFTGSFASGAVWTIDSAGTPTEIASTRDTIGAVSGLAVLMDGTLIAVDQGDSDPRTSGGRLWRVTRDGVVTEFAPAPVDRGWIAPNDVTVDPLGRVYISDSGRNEVWQFEAAGGQGRVWWVPPAVETDVRPAISGLAYDPVNGALIITDPELNRVYRVPITAEGEAGAQTELIYEHGEREFAPGLEGVAVGTDGTIYVAAQGQNGVATVSDNELGYIAGLFRGSADVEFAAPNRLYVANFDSASLLLPLQPSLPFALDVVEISPAEVTPDP